MFNLFTQMLESLKGLVRMDSFDLLLIIPSDKNLINQYVQLDKLMPNVYPNPNLWKAQSMWIPLPCYFHLIIIWSTDKFNLISWCPMLTQIPIFERLLGHLINQYVQLDKLMPNVHPNPNLWKARPAWIPLPGYRGGCRKSGKNFNILTFGFSWSQCLTWS